MRVRALASLLLLVSACGTTPAKPFDTGFEVHFILHAEEPLLVSRTFRPVCAVGDVRRLGTARTFGKGLPVATEVAVLLAPGGDQTIVMWDEDNELGGSVEVDVDGPLWVVLPVEPGNKKAKIEVHRSPPHQELGSWQPLVAVPY